MDIRSKMLAAVSAAVASAAVMAGAPSALAAAGSGSSNSNAGAVPAAASGVAPVNGVTSTGQLQQITITAERRQTSVQQTPIAVTAVTGNQLTELHLATISSLQSTVPSFQSDDTNGMFNNINIRGMGDTFINPAIVTGVAVFRDGILMGETIGQEGALYDIRNVAVLKGPQGTLVGGSSTAGAVEITTNNPVIGGGVHGYVQAQIGNYTDTESQAAVNLPVSNTFAARAAFNWIHRNSFSKNIGSQALVPGDSEPITDPGHDYERDARVSLLWKPGSKYQALGKIEYTYIDTGDAAQEPNPQTYTTLFSAGPQKAGIEAGCTLGGPLNVDQLVCPLAGTVQHSQFYYPGEKPFVLDYAPENANAALNYYIFHYSLQQDLTFADGVDLRSLSGFVTMNFRWLPNVSYSPANAGWQYHEFPDDNYYSQELDLISPTTGAFFSKFNWLVGSFFYYRYTPVYLNNLSVPAPYTIGLAPTTDLIASNLATARTAAVFGQFNWQFTRTLQLELGARENWDNNFSTQDPPPSAAPRFVPQLSTSGAGVYAINYCGAAGPPICAAQGLGVGTPLYSLIVPIKGYSQYSDTVPTGKIDLNWVPMPGQNFYVFYARGYKSGGPNAGSTDHPTWSPEHVNDYELGWKGRLFHGHMLTQVGGYYYDYQDMQFQIFDPEANNDTTTGNVVVNLAPTTIYGIELAEQARFGGLGVDFGLSYNKTKLGSVQALDSSRLPGGFGSPINHPQCLPGHTYSAAAPCFDYTPYLTNVSGEQNPFAPLITGNLSVDYAFPVGGGVLDPRVTYSHTDKQYDSPFQDAYNLMGARNLWSASVDFDAGQWEAQLYGTNLTNQIYIIGGGTNVTYGPPRQFGVRVTRRF